MNSVAETNILESNKRLYLVLEFLAVFFGVIYTVLYIQEVKFCFVFAVLGALLYSYLCYIKQILAESFLQLFYILTAIYGWFNWGNYGTNSYAISTHILFLIFTILAVVGVGYFLKTKVKSKLPYLDSFTTVSSLTGTWLMVNFIHETWLYFIAINAVSMFLYYQRGLKISVLLFAFYVYLSIAGWFDWELFF